MEKKDISYIDWAALAKKELDKQVLTATGIYHNAKWLLPQLLALVAKFPLSSYNSRVSPTNSLKAIAEAVDEGGITFSNGRPLTRDMVQGILAVLRHTPRGDLVGALGKQSSKDNVRYGASVPLILSAFKQYRNLNYSDWDFTDPAAKFFVEKNLLDALGAAVLAPKWAVDDLLQFRVTSCTVHSGARAGEKRDPIATTSVTGVTDPEFKALPPMLKLQLCQLWVYHPEIRHKYAINDFSQPDNMPEPLLKTEVLEKSQPDDMWNL